MSNITVRDDRADKFAQFNYDQYLRGKNHFESLKDGYVSGWQSALEHSPEVTRLLDGLNEIAMLKENRGHDCYAVHIAKGLLKAHSKAMEGK